MPGPYDVLYIDPAWEYRNKKTGGSHTSGSAQKYQTMAFEELLELRSKIRRLAARSSVMALWGTTPFGRDPYDLMEHWGWEYKTEIYWHKIGRKGTGYWLRGEVEKCLIGIRGTVPAWRENLPNWIDGDEAEPTLARLPAFAEAVVNAIGEISKTEALDAIEKYLREVGQPLSGYASPPQKPHSRKPAAVRDLLTAMSPGQRRVELFATERVEGWDSYGLDLGDDFRNPAFWEQFEWATT